MSPISSEAETKVATARNLLEEGISPDVISRCVGLSLEEVEGLDGKNGVEAYRATASKFSV